jgi:FkbM family methyltransferase
MIRVGRRLIANTPVQRLPLTTEIYRRVFRLGYPSDEVRTNFRGLDLALPTSDVTIVPGLIGGYYEKLELDLFERLCAASRTVLDVGGNIGLFASLAAARLQSDDGTVVCFEPVPGNLTYLRRNLEQNGLTGRVTVEASAVGERAGTIDIFLVDGAIGTHSASSKNALNSVNAVSVPVVSLDAYTRARLSTPVDLLKIDVEGYEGHVLRGAMNMLTEQRPSLFVEYVPVHLANCGFPPKELLDIVFGLYPRVYLVDDVRGVIRRSSTEDLLDRALEHKNGNLIAVDDGMHPEHARAIEEFVSQQSRS